MIVGVGDMRIELIRCGGFGRREKIVLKELPVMIGSNPEVGLRLNDRRASRVHCLLAEHDQRLLVRDLNSKHGTFVNGARVKEAPLMPGDRLTVGRSRFIVSTGNGSPIVPTGVESGTLFVVSDAD